MFQDTLGQNNHLLIDEKENTHLGHLQKTEIIKKPQKIVFLQQKRKDLGLYADSRLYADAENRLVGM